MISWLMCIAHKIMKGSFSLFVGILHIAVRRQSRWWVVEFHPKSPNSLFYVSNTVLMSNMIHIDG